MKIEAGKTSKEDEQVNFQQDKCKVCFLFQCGWPWTGAICDPLSYFHRNESNKL